VKPKPYTVDCGTYGFSVHHARTGWVVNGWSRNQGARSRWRVLITYQLAPRLRTRALDEQHRGYHYDTTVGDHIYQVAADWMGYSPDIRILRKGHVVK
jgi:hypothetical protein